ncbi:sugar phosphate isomerase/epimerase family protein [Amycolatopsis sp. CA-230715]|uniref:sugar phosphate isomerase/epimerase family protein n=1 Tax=Amycolatopsis sp. CA-230715 TaxID=2745196 RepID=UPI001C0335B8|nr:sugar phosphate isomerase/epimerase family protein [Amycolatopsis sp. CA-230715]QWF83846.1 Inosose dehydratase [Amycolatopsis sp. CA-230715]
MHADELPLAGIGDEAGQSLADQLETLRLLGWRHLELRTVDGLALADLDRARAREIAATVLDAGITVVCLDSRIGSWSDPIDGPFAIDLAELDTLAEWCARLGTRYVRVMSYPDAGLTEPEWRHRVFDRIGRLTERAERAGIVLVHENCSGWAGSSADRMVRLLDAIDSPSLRLLFDTGNGVAHGYVAYDLLAEVVDRVEHVHVKDAVSTVEGVRYTLPGDGQSAVADCVSLLLTAGYRGALSIEPHLAVVPHTGSRDERYARELFVAAGERLRRLVDRELLDRVTW